MVFQYAGRSFAAPLMLRSVFSIREPCFGVQPGRSMRVLGGRRGMPRVGGRQEYACERRIIKYNRTDSPASAALHAARHGR